MDRDSVLPPLEDELSRALLRSAQIDEPSRAAYAKAASALGVGVGVGAAVGLGASLPAPAFLAAVGGGVSGAARWYGSAAAKLVLCGVSGVLLVAGSALFLRHRAANGAAASVVHARAAAEPLLGAALIHAPQAQPAQAPAALPAPASEPRAAEVAVPRSAPVAGNSVARASAASVHASSLPEQVLSLDRARVALSSGDPRAALQEIAHYRSAWPKGVFLTEASVLEIEALAKSGERSLAAMRAQAFVAAHPDSPQVDRLRALIPSGSR